MVLLKMKGISLVQSEIQIFSADVKSLILKVITKVLANNEESLRIGCTDFLSVCALNNRFGVRLCRGQA